MDIALSKDDLDVRARPANSRKISSILSRKSSTNTITCPMKKEQVIHQAVLDYRLNAINHSPEFGETGHGRSSSSASSMKKSANRLAPYGAGSGSRDVPEGRSRDHIERHLIPACKGDLKMAFCTSEPYAGSDAGGIRTECRFGRQTNTSSTARSVLPAAPNMPVCHF